MESLTLDPFDAGEPAHIAAATNLWNAACGPALACSEQAIRFNTRPSNGAARQGRLARAGGEPVGFVVASAMLDDPTALEPGRGWIDALAVIPGSQGRGIGSALLAWAEAWLAEMRCTHVVLGASLRPFVPGVPVELGTEAFFRRRVYQPAPGTGYSWDLAHNLVGYTSPPTALRATDVVVRPMEAGEEGELSTFLWREFPGRWRYEFEEFMREGGHPSDYLLLWSPQGVDGFCQVTTEDSVRPLDRFFPYALPRPWGQVGSIGVSKRSRGLGYGSAVVDGGLRRLRDRGVAGCVIDWTGLLDFYGKFGFTPYRKYAMLGAPIPNAWPARSPAG